MKFFSRVLLGGEGLESFYCLFFCVKRKIDGLKKQESKSPGKRDETKCYISLDKRKKNVKKIYRLQ